MKCRYCGGSKTNTYQLSCAGCYELGLRYVYWERAVKAKKPLMIDVANFEKIPSPITFVPTGFRGRGK